MLLTRMTSIMTLNNIIPDAHNNCSVYTRYHEQQYMMLRLELLRDVTKQAGGGKTPRFHSESIFIDPSVPDCSPDLKRHLSSFGICH
jgi:hypothetical protein